MLIAVLLSLSLLPLALPADVRQDPAPTEPFMQWDGETEDAYRRALHLWAVRGKPGEAADILLALADKAEVTQIAGQASWVLVLAAQALAEAGRTDEAAALIPGIERGARGTALAAYVDRELATLSGQLGVGSNGLDPAFDEYFRETVVKQGTGDWLIDTYGRSLLPYILNLIETWQSDPKEASVVIQAVQLGWAIADDEYVQELLRISKNMSTLSYLTVFGSGRAAGDLTARKSSLQFWLTQSRSGDQQRAASAGALLPNFLLRIDDTADLTILNYALASDSDLLSRIIEKLTGNKEEAARKLLLAVAREAPPELARAAGNALSQFGIQEVVDLASSGALTDVARYLVTVARIRLDNWAMPVGNESLERIVMRLANDCQVKDAFIRDQASRMRVIEWQPPLVSGWEHALDVPNELLANESLRSLLAFAAVGMNDADALDQALASGPPLHSEVLLFMIGQYKGPLCSSIWNDLATYQRLAPKEALEMALRANAKDVNLDRARQIYKLYPDFREWEEIFGKWSELGLSDDLRSVLLDPSLTWKVRYEAARPYLQSDASRDGQLITGMLQGWRSLPEADQRYLTTAISVLYQDVPDALNLRDQSDLLQLFFDLNVNCFLVGHALRSENEADWKPILDFMTDPSRASWIATYLHGSSELTRSAAAPAVALAMVRAGMLDTQVLPGDPDSRDWLRPGSAEALEVARIFLQSSDGQPRNVALNFLLRDCSAYLALQEELVRYWRDPEFAGWMSYVAAKHAKSLDATDRIRAAWQLPDLQDRSLVLRAMINTTDPRFVPVLLEAISDADQKVASTAREGLQRLKEIEEQRAFWESWQATGVGGSPTAALLKQIQSKNKEVRLSAIRALGALKAPEALPLLISLLEDPDPEVVAAARAGLTWLNPESAPK